MDTKPTFPTMKQTYVMDLVVNECHPRAQPRAQPLGTSLASKTLACNWQNDWSTSYPCDGISLWASYPKDSVYNQLSNLLKWFELVRSLHKHKYHIDAKMTWLTTKILLAKENFLPPHSNKNFFTWLCFFFFPPLLKWTNEMKSPSTELPLLFKTIWHLLLLAPTPGSFLYCPPILSLTSECWSWLLKLLQKF